MTETKAAQTRISEELIADVADGNAESHRCVTFAPPGEKTICERDFQKPGSTKLEPENAIRPGCIAITPGSPTSEPKHVLQFSDNPRPSDPESLISRLEAAKKRFDNEMTLGVQGSWTPSLKARKAGAADEETGVVKLGNPALEVASLNATEEANGKLRMVLQSFAQPKATTNHLQSNVPQAMEYNEPVSEQLGDKKPEPFKRDKFYEVVESANHQLRMMLSNIQKLEADENNLHPSISLNGDDSHEHSESEEGYSASSITTVSAPTLENAAVQSQIVVKGGRWFKTPRGSLKRIEDEQRVDERLKDHEVTSPTNNLCPENRRGSSENLFARGEDDKVADFCDVQLLLRNGSQLNSFQVSDVDKIIADFEEESAVGGFTQIKIKGRMKN